MCQCTPNIRTPFCGRGTCVWPDAKPEGARTDANERYVPWSTVRALLDECESLKAEVDELTREMLAKYLGD